MADVDALSRLVEKADAVAESASVLVERTIRDIRGEIANLSEELNLAGSAADREKAYAEIRRRMAKLSRRLDALMAAQNELAGKAAAKQAAQMTGLEVKYSAKRAEAITELVTPKQGENLAAVFTQRMAANLINSLQAATVAVLRQQAVEGGTMREMTRELARKWRETAKTAEPKFTDASGRTWDTKSYLAMNVRTNTMRVYNDCLLDDIARTTGSDIARISDDGGDPHCVCAAWAGCVISISGKTKGLPTYEQARNGGCFHPNCVHTLEYIDEDADAEEIALAKAHPVQKGLEDDPDAQYERRREIDIDRKMHRDRSISRSDAELLVDRDNLTAAIRSGLIRSDARKMVDALTDAQVKALMTDNRPPRFEPTKKATKKDPHVADEKWNHGSRGGVVHIKRDADLAHILSVTKADKAAEPRQSDESGHRNTRNAPDAWKPTTALERTTDALMAQIGAKHTKGINGFMGSNPKYTKEKSNVQSVVSYQKNCQRCVPTAEIRYRGYDVIAMPRQLVKIGRKWESDQDDIMYSGIDRKNPSEFLFPTFKDAKPISYMRVDDIEKKMSEWGDGARAQVVCKWNGGGGHTFMAVNDNGKIKFVDPQTGSDNCAWYFNLIAKSGDGAKFYNKFARIDNLYLNDRIKFCVTPNTQEEGS